MIVIASEPPLRAKQSPTLDQVEIAPLRLQSLAMTDPRQIANLPNSSNSKFGGG